MKIGSAARQGLLAALSQGVIDVRRSVSGVLLLLAAAFSAGRANAGTVAITVDDLPIYGRPWTVSEGETRTTALLAAFARHRWHVTGFVNEKQLEGPDHAARVSLLERWLAAGHDLGNHTYSHPSLNKVGAAAFIADIDRGGIETSRLLERRGRTERWFRYPFLETGVTRADRDHVSQWLEGHGLHVAPVTMENADWQFATPYDAALARGDSGHAAAIRRAYIAYTAAAVHWYRVAGRQLLGREPAFVLLIHADQLNADTIDSLAATFRREHLHVVSLDRAMRDPAYRLPDRYVGPDGIEWLERWSQALHRSLPFGQLPSVPDWIVKEDAVLEATPPTP